MPSPRTELVGGARGGRLPVGPRDHEGQAVRGKHEAHGAQLYRGVLVLKANDQDHHLEEPAGTDGDNTRVWGLKCLLHTPVCGIGSPPQRTCRRVADSKV